MNNERFELLIETYYAKAAKYAGRRRQLAAVAGIDGEDAAQMAAVQAVEQHRLGVFADYSDAEFGDWLICRAQRNLSKAGERRRALKRDATREQPMEDVDLPARSMRDIQRAESAADHVAELMEAYPQHAEVLEAMRAGMNNRESAKHCGLSSEWAVKRIKANIRKDSGIAAYAMS